MTKTITIKVTAPEDYNDVCDQIVLDDFVGQPKGFGVELLLNVRGECCLCTGEFEDIHIKFDQKKAEIETLRAKLEKAEKIIACLESVLTEDRVCDLFTCYIQGALVINLLKEYRTTKETTCL